MKALPFPIPLIGARFLAPLSIAFLLLASIPGQAQQGEPAHPQNALNAVSLARGNNDSQVVRLVFKNTVTELPIAFTTANPHRLVLDFPATISTLPPGAESAEGGTIKTWQVVQAGERTRLVLNLTSPASYELRKDRNVVLAVLHGIPVPAEATAPARFAESGPARSHGIRDIDFRRGKDGESRILVTLSDPGTGVDIKQEGGAIQVDFLNTSLPSPLQRRLDVSDFATPAQQVETFERGNLTRMRVTPKGKWDYSAWQTGNQFTLEVRSLEGEKAAADKPQYSGEKLSLNFQNVEVRAVLQVIADFTGLNIITSDTVSGNVTLRLKDVPWDQALDIILRAKGLDKRTSGNVIWIAPRDELAAKEKLELEAKKSLAELDPLVTRSYRLNYVKANEAMSVLNGGYRSSSSVAEDATCSPSSTGIKPFETGTQTNISQATQASNPNRILSARGGSSYDLTTNTLIVSDTQERHAAIETVLKSIDVASRQVMIDARIVVADDSFGRSLGAKLGFSGSGKVGNTGIGIGTYDSSAGFANTAATTGLTSTSPSANVNLGGLTFSGVNPSNSASSLGVSIFNAGAAGILSLELQAMELDHRGKIVSNPRVVTTNLRPAVIMQGKQIPYQSSSANTGTTVQFKDAVLCLLVAPQVLNNDSIILNVEIQKDSAETAVSGTPPIDVQRVKTQVRVNNGETAVLGGIFEQTLRNDSEKVPFLGDIPILGHLFRNDVKQDVKSELMIFLTPRILVEDTALTR